MPAVQCRDPDAAMRVFTEMRERSRLQPDVVAYTSLLAALQGTPKVGNIQTGIGGQKRGVGWGTICRRRKPRDCPAERKPRRFCCESHLHAKGFAVDGAKTLQVSLGSRPAARPRGVYKYKENAFRVICQ